MKSPAVGCLEEIKTFLAVVTYHGQTTLEVCPLNSLAPKYIRIRVHAIGLCRTDLRVISGEIKASRPLIPGHEFSGTVESVGVEVVHLKPGDRVVVNPWVNCRECEFCDNSRFEICQSASMLGVHFDGALAECVAVPEHVVYKIPEGLSFEVAAFAEPVAASLAVLNAPIISSERGLILGENRIAELTRRILEAHGFGDVTTCSSQNCDHLRMHSFDFVIETESTTEILRRMIQLVRPRGKLVLKSRQLYPTSFAMMDILPKEPQMYVVNYGSFTAAVEMLAARKVCVNDLIGQKFALEGFQDAIEAAKSDEAQKVFVVPKC